MPLSNRPEDSCNLSTSLLQAVPAPWGQWMEHRARVVAKGQKASANPVLLGSNEARIFFPYLCSLRSFLHSFCGRRYKCISLGLWILSCHSLKARVQVQRAACLSSLATCFVHSSKSTVCSQYCIRRRPQSGLSNVRLIPLRCAKLTFIRPFWQRCTQFLQSCSCFAFSCAHVSFFCGSSKLCKSSGG